MHKIKAMISISCQEVTLQVQDKTLNNNVEDLTTAVNQMNGNLILMIKDRLDCIPGNLLSSCPASSAGTFSNPCNQSQK